MISETKCRKILEDDGQKRTDQEIRDMREFLYKAAEIIFDIKTTVDGDTK